jgi:hypothetical protein
LGKKKTCGNSQKFKENFINIYLSTSKIMQKAHGLYSVMGNFGGGKTFGTFLDLYKLDKNENYIIANVPYSRVDLFFSTKEQLFSIIDDLETYCQDTNYDIQKYYNQQGNLKNIILVVDEAHLYFPAR